MTDFSTGIKIEDIDVDLAVPAIITINRGAEPSLIEFVVSDEEDGSTRFDQLENPVTIKINAPDEYGDQQTLELEKWYITSIEPHSPGLKSIVIQDVRWAAQQRRLTKDYNVYETGAGLKETPRASSLNGGQDWTVYDALIDALEAFGLEHDSGNQLSASDRSVVLPHNLGNNTMSGGFIGAPLGFVLPVMAEVIHHDLVIRPNGKFRLVDRHLDRVDALDNWAPIGGAVEKRDTHWQWPKTIEVMFETRLARFFDYRESLTVSTGTDLSVQNAVPVTHVTDSLFGTDAEGGYGDLLFRAQDAVGLSLTDIRNRWLKPRLVPIDDNWTDEKKALYAQWDNLLRQHFRQTFKIVDVDGLKTMVDLRMGHLGPNGSSINERSVYMPYTYVYRYTNVDKEGSAKEIVNTNISESVQFDPFTAADYKPAPWLPVLFYDKNGAVILHLEAQDSFRVGQLHPGLFGRPVRFGDIVDLTSDDVNLPTVYQTPLRGGFYTRIYYHGLLTEDRTDIGIDRLKKIELPLLDEGKVEKVQYLVRDITSNVGYSDKKGLAGNILEPLNEAEVRERAEFVAEQVKRNFVDGKAGVFQTAGVSAITNADFWVEGNVNSLNIMIGSRAPYTVVCQWVVMPEVRPVITSDIKKAMQGAPVYKIGGG